MKMEISLREVSRIDANYEAGSPDNGTCFDGEMAAAATHIENDRARSRIRGPQNRIRVLMPIRDERVKGCCTCLPGQVEPLECFAMLREDSFIIATIWGIAEQ